MIMSLCKSFPTYLGFSRENPKHCRPWYLPSKLMNLLPDGSSEAPNVLREPGNDNSGLCLVELPSLVTEKSEAGDGTALEISSKLGVDIIEDREKNSEDYVDSWSLLQPEKSFESLLGDLPVPVNVWPCSLGICPLSKNSCSNSAWPLKCDYSLQFCTESLGFESSDEREDCTAESNSLMNSCDEENEEEKRVLENDSEFIPDAIPEGGAENVMNSAVCAQDHGPVGAKRCGGHCRATSRASKFPPPLPSLAGNGQPCVFLKPLRKDGRFLLQEVKVPPHEFLHASRHEGRLRLQLIRNHDDHSSQSSDTTGDEFTSALG